MNAEQTHTPGPWFAEVDHVVARTHEGGYLSRQSSIAICYAEEDPTENHKNPEVLANARLIAAAPDLLKELQHLVRLLQPLEENGGFNVPGLATLNGARLAIAKATQP